jgi:hypothetical protein
MAKYGWFMDFMVIPSLRIPSNGHVFPYERIDDWPQIWVNLIQRLTMAHVGQRFEANNESQE